MRDDSSRWVEVTRSQFPHEAEGLAVIRELLPDAAPFRAWSNFEFRDSQGKWHEVDLLVLGRRQLHLVELKYYTGTLRGDDHRWLRDGHPAVDSPLKLARRKAQRLATRLRGKLAAWARERGYDINPSDVIPYVQEAVFLHHPELRCLLPQASRLDLFGLDGAEDKTGLPGISTRLLEPATTQEQVKSRRDETIAALLKGIVGVRRRREVASWVLDEHPLAEGDDFQDWLATHRAVKSQRVRVRFYVTPPGASTAEQERVCRLVGHEYEITSRLHHDALLTPTNVELDAELGPALIYPYDERFQRLDLWLTGQRDGVAATTQLAILRQVAEAVAYAHRHGVVHRGLSPATIYVRMTARGEPRVLVGGWMAAGRSGTATTGLSRVTALAAGSGSAGERLAALALPGDDVDRQFAEAFQAPEGVWSPQPNRIRLDVFSLGALAYYLMTGRPPAPDRAALRERLNADHGLDLAADLPQVPPRLRELVLKATRSKVSERVASVAAFLALLADAERELVMPGEEPAGDPLEAGVDALLDGRFRVERRLGAGSTALGLLVADLAAGGERRVLKVALDDAAARRIEAEADVLRGLRHPRLARMIEGPLDVGGRRALLLEPAGEQTLAEELRSRPRMSLDRLERWGTELLEALVELDRAGIDHRDIKPANLGIREGRGDRAKHLVLFDFSLARAGATTLTAGTPPYLDPFLQRRGRYDSAAERYAAAVVLFEMATGATPVYGDGESDPLTIDDEASITPQMFDLSVADALVAFFRRALARDAAARHDTAAEMLAAWRAVFAPVPKTVPDAERLAAAARLDTPLGAAGLSARALSALEPLGVATVGDLVAIDPVRLNRLSGVTDATRREVKARARAWRQRFGEAASAARARGRGPDGAPPDPAAAAELLIARAGGPRAKARRHAARLLLGLEGDLDAFASQAELGDALAVTRVRAYQLIPQLHDAWAKDDEARDLLDALTAVTRDALAQFGGVATVTELADALLAHLTPPADPAAAPRLAAGLARLALDRTHALARAQALDADGEPLARRRRGGRVALLATDPLLLDAAEAAARRADQLVAEAGEDGLVPAQRAATELAAAAHRVAPEAARLTGERLVRLVGRLAGRAAVSGHGELHDRRLSAVAAVRFALGGLGGGQRLTAREVRDRVRARFPALAPLPDRPQLDGLLAAAALPLAFDEERRAYQGRQPPPETTLASRTPTGLRVPPPAVPALTTGGPAGQRLRESVPARSFLALGVEGRHLDEAVTLLRRRHDAVVVDVTQTLIEALRAEAAAAGVPWELVRAADAAEPGSRDALGLAELVRRALPAVDAAITAAAEAAPPGSRPVVLTEVAPLARYDHLGLLAGRADLTVPRRQALWVMVPQLLGNTGPLIDGRPLPLASPGQYVRLDAEWSREPDPLTRGAAR